MNSKKPLNRRFPQFTYILCLFYCSAVSANKTEFNYMAADESYQYSVIQTGENYTFKFNRSPRDDEGKLKAGYHVLRSIYKDKSINKKYSERYIRERARCYMIDSNFYTYSLCFLPNDFNKKNKDRFWGFVTQMPNWRWHATYFFLPVLLVFSLIYFGTRQKES